MKRVCPKPYGKLLLILLLLPLSLWSQNRRFSTDRDSVADRIRQDLSVLASDSLEGRESGTEGERKAARYIIRHFSEIGLTPAGTDSGSFLQPFASKTIMPPQGKSKNFLFYDLRRFSYFYDFGATRFSADTTVEATLRIPASWSEAEQGAPAENDSVSGLRGKILLLDLAQIRSGAEGQVDADRLKEKLSNLFRNGVSAVLLWDHQAIYPGGLFDFSKPDPLPGAVLFLNRSAATELLKRPGTRLALSVRKPVVTNNVCTNVVAGIDHGAKQTIIIGAHYDHLGKGEAKGGKVPEIRYGADDNASGTAGMIELARQLKQSGNPAFNYLFVAFSGEEEGLLGSEYFCEQYPFTTDSVRFMVNFDMIGRLGCEGNRITAMGKGSSSGWKELYRKVPHPGFQVRDRLGAPGFSDHYPFLRKRIPVIYLTTGTHRQYHTPADRADRINYTGMADIVAYSRALIDAAQGQERTGYRKIGGFAQFIILAEMLFREL